MTKPRLMVLGVVLLACVAHAATQDGYQGCVSANDFFSNGTLIDMDAFCAPFVYGFIADCNTCAAPPCAQAYCLEEGHSVCGSPVPELGIGVHANMSDCSGAPEGFSCTVRCEPGYHPDPLRPDITCIENAGYWSQSACLPDNFTCIDPSYFIGGSDESLMYSCAGAAVGETCDVQCLAGHTASDSTITCELQPDGYSAAWTSAECTNDALNADFAGCYFLEGDQSLESCDPTTCCCLGTTNTIPGEGDDWGPIQIDNGVLGQDPTGSYYFLLRHFEGDCLVDPSQQDSFFTHSALVPDSDGRIVHYWNGFGYIYMQFAIGISGPQITFDFISGPDCTHTQTAIKGVCPTPVPTLPPVLSPDITILNQLYAGTEGADWLHTPADDDQFPFSDAQWCAFNRTNSANKQDIRIGCQVVSGETRVTEVLISDNRLDGKMKPFLSLSVKQLAGLRLCTKINLSGNLLRAPFPAWSQMGNRDDLPVLETLDLSFNPINTALTVFVGVLPSLKVLKLNHCGLFGDASDSPMRSLFGPVSRLEEIYLQKNFFTGPLLSAGIAAPLAPLRVLLLGRNHMGGPGVALPTDIFTMANFPQLTTLGLNDNRFGGLVPASMELLSAKQSGSAKQVNLGYNDLQCPLAADYRGWFQYEDSWYYHNLVCCPGFDTGVYECCCDTDVPSDVVGAQEAFVNMYSTFQTLNSTQQQLPLVQDALLALYSTMLTATTTGQGIPRFRVNDLYGRVERYNINYQAPGGYGGPHNGEIHGANYYS